MTNEMRRLCDAVAEAQYTTDPRKTDMREAIVRAVLVEMRQITDRPADTSIHEAQVARYTNAAITRLLCS